MIAHSTVDKGFLQFVRTFSMLTDTHLTIWNKEGRTILAYCVGVETNLRHRFAGLSIDKAYNLLWKDLRTRGVTQDTLDLLDRKHSEFKAEWAGLTQDECRKKAVGMVPKSLRPTKTLKQMLKTNYAT